MTRFYIVLLALNFTILLTLRRYDLLEIIASPNKNHVICGTELRV